MEDTILFRGLEDDRGIGGKTIMEQKVKGLFYSVFCGWCVGSGKFADYPVFLHEEIEGTILLYRIIKCEAIERILKQL